MNINLIKLKSVVQELRGIRQEISRLADCWEAELSLTHGYHVKPPKADTSGDEPSVVYTEEDEDWAREAIDRLRREDEMKRKEDEQA